MNARALCKTTVLTPWRCPQTQRHDHESHEPAPMAATPAVSLRQEEAGGDIQTTTAPRVGPRIGEPTVELDGPQGGEHIEASGVVVMLTDPEQMANAVFLKSEKIVYCPIQKVMSLFPSCFYVIFN